MSRNELSKRTLEYLKMAELLERDGVVPTTKNLAVRLRVSTARATLHVQLLRKLGLWRWGGKKAPGRGQEIQVVPEVIPSSMLRRRWPKVDWDQVERDMEEWRRKAGPRLHPAT